MQNVLNALRVIEEIAARQPIGVSELSRLLEMPKTSVQRAVRTLDDAGWLRPVGTERTRWALTTRALEVGKRALGDLSLRDAAVPIMEALRERTGETIHLNVYDETAHKAVLIERLETSKPIRITLPLGFNPPLAASANGKAILACHTPAEVEQILADGLHRHTDATIVDMAQLMAELAAIRERGYATNGREWRDDIAAVGAAIQDEHGKPIGSMSISTPHGRMPEELRPFYGELVHRAAQDVSKALGYLPGR